MRNLFFYIDNNINFIRIFPLLGLSLTIHEEIRYLKILLIDSIMLGFLVNDSKLNLYYLKHFLLI